MQIGYLAYKLNNQQCVQTDNCKYNLLKVDSLFENGYKTWKFSSAAPKYYFSAAWRLLRENDMKNQLKSLEHNSLNMLRTDVMHVRWIALMSLDFL